MFNKKRNPLLRRIGALAAALLAAFALFSLPAFAEEWHGRDIDIDRRVYDFGDYLTGEQEDELSARSGEYSDALSVDFIAVVTGDSLGMTPQEYAEAFYRDNKFGYYDQSDGIILYINMVDRDVYVATAGIIYESFTTSDTDYLCDVVIDGLASGEDDAIYRGVGGYLDGAEAMARELVSGLYPDQYSPDYPNESGDTVPGEFEPEAPPNNEYSGSYTYQPSFADRVEWFFDDLFYSFLDNPVMEAYYYGDGSLWLIPAVLTLFTLLVVMLILNGMQKKRISTKPRAGRYSPEGLKLTHQKDVFVSTNTVRVALPKDDNSSRGSGSSGSSSRGSSSAGSMGGSGKKF